jgi:hypothetical protein
MESNLTDDGDQVASVSCGKGQEINPEQLPVPREPEPEHHRLISEIKYLDIDELKPHTLNADIYGNGLDEELLENIRVNGVLQPLLATWEKVVLGGHQRLDCARKAGLLQVPVVFTDSTDEDDMAEVLLDSNRQRKKTPEQLAREIQEHARLERLKAAKRQATAAKGKRGGQSDPARSPGGIWEVREIVAEKVGVGIKKVDAALTTIKAIDEFEKAGEPQKAIEIKNALSRSMNAGKNKAVELMMPKRSCQAKGSSDGSEKEGSDPADYEGPDPGSIEVDAEAAGSIYRCG